MNTVQKLAALREHMKEAQVDGYLIPSADPHMTEYLPEHYKARSWFSGFTGSAGTLAVTKEKAALWTDGRYFVQAAKQLTGSGIELMRMGQPDVDSVEEWLAEALPAKGVMGICGEITSAANVEKLAKQFKKKEIVQKDVDLIAPIWGNDRPELPVTQAWILEEKYAGKQPSVKIQELRSALKKEAADGMMISRLDGVAWLLNLRAADVEKTPFAFAFCLVLPQQTMLFVNNAQISDPILTYLQGQGVEVLPYDRVKETLASIQEPVTILYEAEGTNKSLLDAMCANDRITQKSGEDCIEFMKCIKNPTEIANLKKAHTKDGIAMVRFVRQLQANMAAGIVMTEHDAANLVLQCRKEQEGFLDESFDTIAAYGGNAAMMHYHPTKEASSVIGREGFLLMDCGGQYMDGTTDITRTYALGNPTKEEKRAYTLVLKAHIRLAKTIFHERATGGNLDMIPREVFWKEGLDYRCGTGHGVGFVGVIHEGPQRIHTDSKVVMKPGMVVTNEPGIYTEGKLGIRIENELLCTEYNETEYGKFHAFEAVTYCPIDTKAIDTAYLDTDELEWLNQYHAMVEETLSSHLTQEEKTWLSYACQPLCG